jgi:hypothetical protein
VERPIIAHLNPQGFSDSNTVQEGLVYFWCANTELEPLLLAHLRH